MLIGTESVLRSPKIGNFTGSVNGHLTDMLWVGGRSDYRMLLSDVAARIERRLQTLKLSASGASKAAGLSEDAIRNLQRAASAKTPRHGVTTRTITALAPVLRTSVAWLLEGEGDEESEESEVERAIRVVGYVGAGAEAHFYAVAQGDLDQVTAPDGSTPNTVAVEIRGDSLGSLFDRWLVFYDDVRSPVTPDLIGKLCIVGLPDDRILIKKLRRAREGRYDLLSEREPPILAAAVDWAAKVKIMVPR